MKRIKKIFSLITLFAGVLFLITSCEERAMLEYTPYDPAAPSPFTYPDATFYPRRAVLASDTPVFSIEGVYRLLIDSVHVSDGGSYVKGDFSIDDASGVISYDNKNGTINPGHYSVDVSIHTVNSLVRMPEAWKFTVLDVPVSITVTPEEVNTGALQQGEVAEVTWTDESPGQEITTVSFAIVPPVPGFSIDTAGKVLKTTSAPADTTLHLSLQVNTNLGTKNFSDVLTVHVGPPPTILYHQSNGSDTLHRVTLAPTTTWTSQVPQLTGMNDDNGWMMVLPDSVPQEVKDALSVDDQGVITFTGTAGLPDGEYVIGVRVTNSSNISYDFKELFTLRLVTKWEEVIYDDTEFSSDTISYYKDPTSAAKFGDGGGYAKGYHGPDATFISWFVAAVDIHNNWNGVEMTVSFEERNGWGPKQDPVYQEFVRTLQYSYDSTTWVDLMAADDADWPQTGAGSFVSVNDQSMGSVDLTQSRLYFKWYYDNSASATKTKSVWMLDNLRFRYTVDYAVIEE